MRMTLWAGGPQRLAGAHWVRPVASAEWGEGGDVAGGALLGVEERQFEQLVSGSLGSEEARDPLNARDFH